MIIKRFVTIFIVAFLLISAQIFAAENNQKTITRVHLEEIQAYLNKILDFHEEIVKEIIANLPENERDWYQPLHDDHRVVVEYNLLPYAYVDTTLIESQKYIYISTGFLWTEVEIDGAIIKWEMKSEAELAGTLAHELCHLISAYDRKMTPNSDKEYIENEVMTDALAIGALLEEGYRSLAHTDLLERYLETWYDAIRHSRSKWVFEKRIQLVKEMTLEAMVKFPSNEYKEFIIATQEEFEKIKELIKSGK